MRLLLKCLLIAALITVLAISASLYWADPISADSDMNKDIASKPLDLTLPTQELALDSLAQEHEMLIEPQPMLPNLFKPMKMEKLKKFSVGGKVYVEESEDSAQKDFLPYSLEGGEISIEVPTR